MNPRREGDCPTVEALHRMLVERGGRAADLADHVLGCRRCTEIVAAGVASPGRPRLPAVAATLGVFTVMGWLVLVLVPGGIGGDHEPPPLPAREYSALDMLEELPRRPLPIVLDPSQPFRPHDVHRAGDGARLVPGQVLLLNRLRDIERPRGFEDVRDLVLLAASLDGDDRARGLRARARAWLDALEAAPRVTFLRAVLRYAERDETGALAAFRELADDPALGPFARLDVAHCLRALGRREEAEAKRSRLADAWPAGPDRRWLERGGAPRATAPAASSAAGDRAARRLVSEVVPGFAFAPDFHDVGPRSYPIDELPGLCSARLRAALAGADQRTELRDLERLEALAGERVRAGGASDCADVLHLLFLRVRLAARRPLGERSRSLLDSLSLLRDGGATLGGDLPDAALHDRALIAAMLGLETVVERTRDGIRDPYHLRVLDRCSTSWRRPSFEELAGVPLAVIGTAEDREPEELHARLRQAAALPREVQALMCRRIPGVVYEIVSDAYYVLSLLDARDLDDLAALRRLFLDARGIDEADASWPDPTEDTAKLRDIAGALTEGGFAWDADLYRRALDAGWHRAAAWLLRSGIDHHGVAGAPSGDGVDEIRATVLARRAELAFGGDATAGRFVAAARLYHAVGDPERAARALARAAYAEEIAGDPIDAAVFALDGVMLLEPDMAPRVREAVAEAAYRMLRCDRRTAWLAPDVRDSFRVLVSEIERTPWGELVRRPGRAVRSRLARLTGDSAQDHALRAMLLAWDGSLAEAGRALEAAAARAAARGSEGASDRTWIALARAELAAANGAPLLETGTRFLEAFEAARTGGRSRDLDHVRFAATSWIRDVQGDSPAVDPATVGRLLQTLAWPQAHGGRPVEPSTDMAASRREFHVVRGWRDEVVMYTLGAPPVVADSSTPRPTWRMSILGPGARPLERMAETTRLMRRRSRTPDEERRLAERLAFFGEHLIKRRALVFEREADGDGVLTFRVDPALAAFPYAMLPMPGRPGETLGEHFRVRVALWGAAPHEPAPRGRVDVVFGDPEYSPGDGVPRMPRARSEIEAVADAVDDPEVLAGEEATWDRLRAAAPRARTLHVVVHGADRPGEGRGLVLRDEFVTTARIRSLDLRGCRTVVLSVCDGASPSTVDGDTLAAAFLDAGAARVIAPVRPVEDEVSARFMKALHEHGEGDPELALRAMRRSRGGDVEYPYSAWQVTVR